MAKRIKKLLAMCMAISMVMSLLTISAGATADDGTACGYHQHDSVACYGMDYENPVCGMTEETVETVCPITAHGEACYHQHDERCNGYICGETACELGEHDHEASGCHFHSAECACQEIACGLSEHSHEGCHMEHTEGCYGLTCSGPCTESGTEGHDCAASGCHVCDASCTSLTCTSRCTAAEHTHEGCHIHSDACACQLVACTADAHAHDDSCHFHEDGCIGLTCGMKAGQLICTDTNHDNEHVHSEELGCFALHTHIQNAKNEDGCYAETLTCKARKVHTHSVDCEPDGVALGDQAMISKDKYASWADDAKEVANVTLEIGGKKHSNIDVVMILGDAMPTYTEIVGSMIDMFRPILEDGDDNTNIKLGLIALGKSEFNVLDINSKDAILTAENYVDVIQDANDAAAALPIGPTNLEGALREAYAMLARDTNVAAEDKYVYLLSTGRTYWFNDTDDANGEPVTVVNKITISNKDYYYWGNYQWQSQRGEHTSLYRVPDRYQNNWSKYWEDVEKWVAADGDKYVYRMPKGVSFETWYANNQTEFNKTNPKLHNSQRIGMAILNPAPTAENFVTGVMAGVGSGKNPQNAMNYERAQYEAAKAYADLQNAGYNCFALCTEISYQNYSAWMEYKLGYGGLQVGHGFMDMLAGGPGEATLIYDDETGAFNENFFEPIEERIIHALSAGSSVEDFIGYSSNATTGYDFDFMVDGTITLKVGETAYTTTQLTTPNAGATASYTFTAPGATEPTFSLNYFLGNGTTTERFVWNIGEDVTILAPATLTYQVKLPAEKKQTAPGTYTVETNIEATLSPVDSEGTAGANEDFPIPPLQYTVKGEVHTVTVKYVDWNTQQEIPSAPRYVSAEEPVGTAYDVTEKDQIAIAGYTYHSTVGELEGILDSDKEVIVYYTQNQGTTIPTGPVIIPGGGDEGGGEEGEDIFDEDVPLAGLPEEEEELEDLLDEEVPLAMAPATGDASLIWAAMSALSGAGLFLTRKKRDEE